MFVRCWCHPISKISNYKSCVHDVSTHPILCTFHYLFMSFTISAMSGNEASTNHYVCCNHAHVFIFCESVMNLETEIWLFCVIFQNSFLCTPEQHYLNNDAEYCYWKYSKSDDITFTNNKNNTEQYMWMHSVGLQNLVIYFLNMPGTFP